MSELFGSPTGELIYNQEERAALQNALQSEESLGRLAMQPVARRKAEIEVAKGELELEQERKFTQLLTDPGAGMDAAASGKPVSVESTLDNLAVRAANAGLVDRASTLAKNAADIRSKKQTALNQQTQAELNKYRAIVTQTEAMGQLLGGVTDQQSWEAANAQWSIMTGQPSPFADIPYNPKVVKQLNDASLSAKERAMLKMRETEQAATIEYRKRMIANSEARTDIADRRATAAADVARNKEKAGGKTAVIPAPTKQDIEEVQRQMRLEGIDTSKISGDSLRSTAAAIASRARELQRDNKALNRSEAIGQAFADAQKNGDLAVETVNQREVAGFKMGGEKRFAKKAPVNAPPVSLLKAGEITTFKNGQKWTLKNGKPEQVN